MPEKEAIVESVNLSDTLKESLENFKIIYITAPTGWGKTTTIRYHFRTRPHTYVSLWDEGALGIAQQDDTGLVILDDCHVLADLPLLQTRLCDWLRSTPTENRVIMLSRSPLPDWLRHFQPAGLMTVLDSGIFNLGVGEVAKLAEKLELNLSPEDSLRLQKESRGHPLAAQMICKELLEDRPLTSETVRRAYARMFDFLDTELFNTWDSKIRRLLLSVSFFDTFTVELARVLTGDRQVEKTINHLLEISSFIDKQDKSYIIRYQPFRAYLQHKAETAWNQQEVNALYTNAGVYFQLKGDLPAALDCYSKNGSHAKVSEILVEHSKQHPGHGVYFQLRKYYRSLPESEILASPELMCGMSILCSLTFEVEESEKWYNSLKAYADSLSRRSPDYKSAHGLIHYLNIALPHRGSANIKDIMSVAYDRLTRGDIRLPELSVTSNLPSVLRGGKDFSSWVPKDQLLCDTIRTPVAAVLGRLGVGMPDIALAESRYEKGEDISDTFLTLSSRRAEIQRKGAPEMEFVLTALLVKCQCDQGCSDQALHDLTAFRSRMEETGQKQLLPNIDAMRCRIDLLNGGEYAHKWFAEETPDENDFFIMERYRYLTKVRCYIQRGEYLPALTLLGRLLEYFTQYDRTLDKIEALLLLTVCRWRMETKDWRKYLTAAIELAGKYSYVRVFAHLGSPLLPILRTRKQPKNLPENRAEHLAQISDAVQKFAALYPNHLANSGPSAVQDLTKKEMDILRLVTQGKTGPEIRGLLGFTENTLKTHFKKMYSKLGVNSRAEAIAAAQKLHLV